MWSEMWGIWGEGRGEGGEGVAVQGEAADEVVFEENKVRSKEAECGEEAQNEREVRQENGVPTIRPSHY